MEAAVSTYSRPPRDTQHGPHSLLASHSWKHYHAITLGPLDHNPQRRAPEDDPATTISIQQDPENPAGYHLTPSDPTPHPPTSPTLHDTFATITAGLEEAKAPQQPEDEMPQAPPPPTPQERPHQEPLTHPITRTELPPQHRTNPERNGRRDLPQEWAVHNCTLRWDEITLGLQAIRLHWVLEPTENWTFPADRQHLPLTVQVDATITPERADPVTATTTYAVHMPPQASSAPMTVHPGPLLWKAIVITYPAPNNHTHTTQQRRKEICADLLKEHLGVTRTNHTLHAVGGIAQALHGIHTTPMNPQAGEDI